MRFLRIFLRVLRLEVSVYNVMFTLQTSFKVKRLIEAAVNSKEENSSDFCPNYVQEFGLSKW